MTSRDRTGSGRLTTRMPPASNSQAIADHLNYLRLRNVRPATSMARRRMLRSLAAELPASLLEAGRDDLEQWQERLRVTVSSRDTYTYHICAFYRWAHQYGITDENMADRLIRPKTPQRLPRPIPEKDLALAIRCADERMAAWLILAGYAGLRAGEIARLQREHVLDQETPALISVVDGKGGKDRVVPIGPKVLAALQPQLRGKGPLFRTCSGRQMSPNRLTQLVSAHFQGLGLPYTAHNCRHRFGTKLYQLSSDLRMTGDLMGHASPATTALYTAWAPKVGLDTVNELDDGLAA